ncbi:MAG: cytochrome P450 [Acidimicrobiales bacterium]
MSDAAMASDPRSRPVHFDRHAPEYRGRFEEITTELQSSCPVAWSDTYGGHWVISGHPQVFEIARSAANLSNDHDVNHVRKGYKGIAIPYAAPLQVGFLEMDPPEQRDYRAILDPYLSPAAVARWKPLAADVTRACLDEVVESGRIDFIDDLANIVPAVMTLAMMGIPLADWPTYCEPAHATVYTPPDSPDRPRVVEQILAMAAKLGEAAAAGREHRRPGLIDALVNGEVNGRPPTDEEIMGVLFLLIGGGFDTTTALTSHSLEWLYEHPDQRDRLRQDLPGLLDSATEEFLRFYTPAPGDGRTVTNDCQMAGVSFKEGDRMWLSWAMANRDPKVFPDPNEIHLDRPMNRHTSFGLGIHRCIGSNMARMVFKTMITAVLQRMPDYVCDKDATVHYETIGVINGMRRLPATFTPGERRGESLDATLARWQHACDTEDLAEPITRRRDPAATPTAPA